LQREKASIQQKLDGVYETHKDLGERFVKLTHERDHLARLNTEQRQTIQNLHKELGGDPDLVDSEEDDPYLLRRRVAEAEERHKQVTSDMNKKLESQEALLKKTKLERREQALLLVGLQNESKEQTATIAKLRKERPSTIYISVLSNIYDRPIDYRYQTL
jgi:homoaconitase/3-isopropylmalate dehydratase large subunit